MYSHTFIHIYSFTPATTDQMPKTCSTRLIVAVWSASLPFHKQKLFSGVSVKPSLSLPLDQPDHLDQGNHGYREFPKWKTQN